MLQQHLAQEWLVTSFQALHLSHGVHGKRFVLCTHPHVKQTLCNEGDFSTDEPADMSVHLIDCAYIPCTMHTWISMPGRYFILGQDAVTGTILFADLGSRISMAAMSTLLSSPKRL